MNKFYIEKNSYCTKIYIGTDANGKPKYKKLKAQTEKELEKKVREYKNAMDSGLDILKNNNTLLKWVNHYLEAAALFLFCKNTVRRTDAFVSRLSALSMDTYFIHVFVLENVKRISVDVRPSAKILLWISITVLLSFLWAFLKMAAVRFVKKRMAARGSTKE